MKLAVRARHGSGQDDHSDLGSPVNGVPGTTRSSTNLLGNKNMDATGAGYKRTTVELLKAKSAEETWSLSPCSNGPQICISSRLSPWPVGFGTSAGEEQPN